VSTIVTRWGLSAAASAALLLGVAATALAQHGGGKGGKGKGGHGGKDDRTAVVHTEYGPVRGYVNRGVSIFLGIPYAAAPVGDLRWRPPERAARWHQ
jgi:para-nitrobenzyl esterase